jgi:hypothetical protein
MVKMINLEKILKIVFILIIILIIIYTLIDTNNKYNNKDNIKNKVYIDDDEPFDLDTTIVNRDKFLNYNKKVLHKTNEYISTNLPWSNVINTEDSTLPYIFCIKLNIPSLNDYENWKQIVPQINLNPSSREIEVPAKDEATALAIVNLISSNFVGQISIREILDKNLLEISINKAKKHEIVKNKLREQINNKLFITNKKNDDNIIKTESYKKDLVDDNNIEAYDGSDFSFI